MRAIRSNFDAFVSYFEETGYDDAETIKRNLERYCIKTFAQLQSLNGINTRGTLREH